MSRLYRIVSASVAAGVAVALWGAVAPSPAFAAYSKSPPSGLKASDTSNTSMVMTWNRVSGVNRYAIQYSTSSKFSNPKYRVPTNITNQAAAFSSVRDLKPGTRYYFRIRATSNSGSNLSDWSKAYSRSTSTYVYGAPSRPSFSTVMDTSAKASWGEIPNAGQYRVALKATSGATKGTTTYQYFNDNSGTLTGLTRNTSYDVQVRALEAKVDDAGHPYLLTGYSSVSKLTTSSFTVAPPAGLKVVSVAKDKVVLQWQASEGADGYRVQQWTGSSAKRYLNSPQIPASAPGTSFSTSNGVVTATLTRWCDSTASCSTFTAGKTYAFRVTALKGADRISDYTGSSGVTAYATNQPLSVPMNLSVDAVTASSITLSWPIVAGATSYGIQQKLGSTSGTTRYLSELCPNNTGCTVKDGRISVNLTRFAQFGSTTSDPIKAKTSYYFRVTSQKDKVRASEYAPSYTKATTNAFSLSAPALDLVKTESDAITLGWPKTAGAPAYVIDRSLDSEFKKIDYSSCLTQSALDPLPENAGKSVNERRYYNLNTETSYFFRIRVVADCTKKSALSDNSKPISARTTAGTGSLSGTVTNGDTSAGYSTAVKSMVATAYAGSCSVVDANVAQTTKVDADGTFTLDGLRKGTYCVLTSQVGSANYTSPWVVSGVAWNNERRKFKSMATTYTVNVGANTSMGSVPIGTGLKVSGTVAGQQGSGQPRNLDNATVTAMSAPSDDGPEREVRSVTITPTSGAYEFTGLFPGKYRFSVARSGYTPLTFFVRYVEQHSGINIKMCSGSGCVASPTPTQYDGK